MKTYSINKKQYALKDLTLKESKEANRLLKIDSQHEGLAANFDNEDDIEKFLKLVLIERNGKESEPDFSEHVTEKLLLEIIKDFFSVRINQAKDLQNFLVNSIKKPKK